MGEVLIGLVGDVFVNRVRADEVFTEVQEVLGAPAILFGNLEGVSTDQPRPVPSAYSVLSAPAHTLDVYPSAGFSVMSLANNHILDVGYEAMLETRARLRAAGVQTCGAGESISDAREPAIVHADGLRVAFLAYASVFPIGYEARSARPGLAPVRAYNAYNLWRDPAPSMHAPGMQPSVTSVPDEADLAALADDIARAREQADLVVTSFHWGDFVRPYVLTDHERRTARYAVDHGADMVVGHHHHALRGMEWYGGKPIMYGLGHFVFDLGVEWDEQRYEQWAAETDPTGVFARAPYAPGPREGWPLLPMHEDTRMTVMAWATADPGHVLAMGFLPCRLTPDGLVHPLELDSAESDEVVEYIEHCNRSQGLQSRITSDGAPVIAGFETLRVLPVGEN